MAPSIAWYRGSARPLVWVWTLRSPPRTKWSKSLVSNSGIKSVLVETADYWLSVGLAIGTAQPDAATRLLRLMESEKPGRVELTEDAQHFVAEALG